MTTVRCDDHDVPVGALCGPAYWVKQMPKMSLASNGTAMTPIYFIILYFLAVCAQVVSSADDATVLGELSSDKIDIRYRAFGILRANNDNENRLLNELADVPDPEDSIASTKVMAINELGFRRSRSSIHVFLRNLEYHPFKHKANTEDWNAEIYYCAMRALCEIGNPVIEPAIVDIGNTHWDQTERHYLFTYILMTLLSEPECSVLISKEFSKQPERLHLLMKCMAWVKESKERGIQPLSDEHPMKGKHGW